MPKRKYRASSSFPSPLSNITLTSHLEVAPYPSADFSNLGAVANAHLPFLQAPRAIRKALAPQVPRCPGGSRRHSSRSSFHLHQLHLWYPRQPYHASVSLFTGSGQSTALVCEAATGIKHHDWDLVARGTRRSRTGSNSFSTPDALIA